MTEGEHPERPSGFLLGKEFIIVLVIVFSGLSFTLGYFVGKKTVDRETVSPLQAAEGTAQQKRQEPLPAPPDLKAEIAEAGSSPQAVQEIAAEAVPVVAAQDRRDKKNTVAVSQEQQKPAAQSKDEEKAVSHAGVEKTSAAAFSETATDEKINLYTVQIGAFKSAADAGRLKTTFEKKGYKPFISQVKDPKGRKIYKVKTGEFRDKKDAEVLALKLKKTEGLQSYVTTRSE